MISGSNGHIAWGFTGRGMDVLDLVAVEVNRQDVAQYKTTEGWRPFDVHAGVIHEGVADETLTVRGTVWDPVLPINQPQGALGITGELGPEGKGGGIDD